MYFVDREKIEETLTYMESCWTWFSSQEEWNKPIDKLGLERIAQLLIEGIIDVGNQMIDGFIMRDPGSYEDIVDILEDEKVVSTKEAESLKEVIRFRKVLVYSYTDINHPKLQSLLTNHEKAITTFSKNVRSYIEKELGPVSAFLPEK
ncbi:DUF86 domain-containing protein [Bacillus alkalicellulosilyticus]|uniref:DUF86 domain-containing protein n=1 Tax=Alkalihalobacterium alkalicellulosilyticum TaxID=1912214 RepID=UPI0009975273|nr:DUF86 domain-containing protein [Bacillus alkalicellulosilyticus]